MGGAGGEGGGTETFGATVEQRLASLGRADRDLVWAAALLGRRIDSELLAAVAGRDLDEVWDALEPRCRSAVAPGDGGGFGFGLH